MKNLRITISASQDLDKITDYFLAQSIEAGDRFVAAFNQRCIQLARYP
jgi:toxin ParE1/3/4